MPGLGDMDKDTGSDDVRVAYSQPDALLPY